MIMFSTPTIPSVEITDETARVNIYDDNGYLPIHRAAFSGHEAVLKMILDDAQKRNELTQQLEAVTHDINEFTPLLLATAGGRLETIACLIQYPVNFEALDANGHDMAAIAALSQNERTLRYVIDLSIDFNVWKSLFKLLVSIKDDESVVVGRMLELITRHDPSSASYWSVMMDNEFLPALIQVFQLSKQEELLTSAFILLLNLINEVPDARVRVKNVRNAFSSMLKHTRLSNTQILTLLGRVLSSLSEEKTLIDAMVEQGLIECLIDFLDKQRSPPVISAYFDCLSNVVAYASEYQQIVARAKDFLVLIVRVYLEDYDLNLSLAVIRFIRHLVKNNAESQDFLSYHGACEHLLGALAAASKDLQHVTIEAIQAIASNNVRVQQLFIGDRAIEQLLSLFEKTNMSHLQIAIVCTLWTLCENSVTRRRDVATRIGVRKLISFYTLKADEHLRAVTEALNELAKSTASVKMNIQEEIHSAQGIPYLIRLLKADDEMLVLSVLKTLQLTSCAPGFVPNRINQDTIGKNDGIALIVALMMHARTEIIQVEAAQALACITLSHPSCSISIENTLDFSYFHLIDLMASSDVDVQLKASNAFATFAYNNSRVHVYLQKHYQMKFDYFEKFLQDHDDQRRCAAAFQIVVLAHFIPERRAPVNTAIGCGILMDILRKSPSDDAKSVAAECLARLAHMKSASEVHKHTGVPQALIAVNAIDYLCQLFSSSNETTIGNAATALGFLSYVPEGRRKLLHKCRHEPDLMNFLKLYNCLPNHPPRLSKHLLDDWNRYDQLKLPKLRSLETNIRYFEVSPTSLQRSRAAAPSVGYRPVQSSSSQMKFYLPALH